MGAKLDEELLYLIYATVEEIPRGKVATYGQIARLIGREKNARLIGTALKMASMYGDFPCHRVVNHQGRTVPGWDEQISLLLAEGVTFKNSYYVDLKTCQWNI